MTPDRPASLIPSDLDLISICITEVWITFLGIADLGFCRFLFNLPFYSFGCFSRPSLNEILKSVVLILVFARSSSLVVCNFENRMICVVHGGHI